MRTACSVNFPASGWYRYPNASAKLQNIFKKIKAFRPPYFSPSIRLDSQEE
jgi:hypothetical protein